VLNPPPIHDLPEGARNIIPAVCVSIHELLKIQYRSPVRIPPFSGDRGGACEQFHDPCIGRGRAISEPLKNELLFRNPRFVVLIPKPQQTGEGFLHHFISAREIVFFHEMLDQRQTIRPFIIELDHAVFEIAFDVEMG
jgi:hypothetical protein